MTERMYLKRLNVLWPRGRKKVSERALKLAERAVRDFPASPALLIAFGDLISLTMFSPRVSERFRAMDPLALYLQAVKASPTYFDAHESAAYYYYVSNDLRRAQSAFRKAIRYGGGPDSFVGLACVLLERGKQKQAAKLLAECPYPRATLRRCASAGDLHDILSKKN